MKFEEFSKLDEKELSEIEDLDLSYGEIGDYGMKKLSEVAAHLTNVTTLNLTYNSISYIGMRAFVVAAPHLTKVTNLDLSSNYIGDAGMDLLIKAIPYLVNLTNLGLCYTNISEYALNNFAKAASQLTNLTHVNAICNHPMNFNNIDYKCLGFYLPVTCKVHVRYDTYICSKTLCDIRRKRTFLQGCVDF
jgi:Ran GTPase-activating protein (RanGAP) involved in mRNA processing and transport